MFNSKHYTCYCTKSGRNENVNMIVVHKSERDDVFFFATKILVETPSYGYSSPLKDGLVFFSLFRPDPSEFSKYDNFKKSDFESLKTNFKAETNNDLSSLHPVTFIDIRSHQYSVNIETPVLGKFVYLKLLRTEPVDTTIDIQKFEICGHSVSLKDINRDDLYTNR
eukprot:TRINITY_DN14985_c0_g1_i1.p1 TRINITY_DN14985_c0_g1~~TRINITY_DN14985_c0_g1_i1.p1  ORF type:complete len:166 (+),score=11.52 TRINITY_DN14985_c0_g1_i1:277-774(+)